MSDRLALIEARWREAGCGDADKAWLIEEVKRLRAGILRVEIDGKGIAEIIQRCRP